MSTSPGISKKDAVVLAGCVGGSVLSYQLFKYLLQKWRSDPHEWVPVGRIKELWIYPIKSCKAIPVFSMYCDYLCGNNQELFDRKFLVTNPDGHFFTGRVKPQLLTVEVNVQDDTLLLTYKDRKTEIPLKPINERKQLVKATLFRDERQDGYDCGDEAAKFFTAVCEEPARLVMHVPGLYTERLMVTQEDFWNNNEVPKRTDDKPYSDNTPYMVTTVGSLDDLNKKLEHKLPSVQFRANVVVEGCAAWDEDKWGELRFGDRPDSSVAEMQCYRPCDRCIMTKIDPKTGVPDMEEPLRTMREFRLTTGKMANRFKAPIFGVHTGMNRPGFIHQGQTVWARYKKGGAF
ncbi:unnamed protein product, partial [Mesorhabditis spiculigera]